MARRSLLSRDEKLILYYTMQTGIADPSMPDVAAWAKAHNVIKMPKAKTDVELLAKRLSRSAREATREDEDTGLFYRSHLAYQVTEGGEKKVRWFDPDGESATREKFSKARTLRREQMVGDAFQYAVDDARWNRKHPKDEPFQLDLDFTDDVVWRMNGIAEQKKKAS